MSKRVSQEDVKKYFDKHSNDYNGKEMMEMAMKLFDFSETTARTYYYKWKREYMNGGKVSKPKKSTVKHVTNVNKTIKEKERKAMEKLKVLSMTLQGENGTYKVCEKGVELKSEGLVMFFENLEQLECFTKEYRKVFGMIK